MSELDRRNFLTRALVSLGLTADTLPLSRRSASSARRRSWVCTLWSGPDPRLRAHRTSRALHVLWWRDPSGVPLSCHHPWT